jgi:tetratricopeptide (TPR) repeat protein
MKNSPVFRPAVACMKIAFICTFFFLLFGSVPAIGNQPLEDYLAEADRLAEVEWNHGKALEVLNDALLRYPDNDEILWRISRAYADSAEVLQKIEKAGEGTIEHFYQLSKAFADRAIEQNPDNSMAYARRAIATGQLALFRGIWGAIDLVKQTRDAVEKALELDDQNSTAHFVYARSHAEVSQRPRLFRRPLGLGWANVETGLEHFDKAVELRPDFILFRIDAARVFIREKKYDRARELLAAIPDLPDQTRYDKTHREDARKLYEEIQNR